ncbi:MAG: DMT family transporter [Candidatus Puniceispirillaceae bacterium]
MVGAADQPDRYLNIPLGVSIGIAEILLTVGISVLVKFIAPDFAIITILLFRYALCLPLLILAAIFQHGRAAFAVSQYGILAARTVAGLTSLTCFYAALDLMSLAKVTTLFQTLTLFITFLAPFLLGERVGWRRWTAVIVGFGGAIMVISPGADGWSPMGVALGFGAPFFGALMLVMLRKLGRSDNPASTAIWYNGAGAVLFALLFVWQGETLPMDQSSLSILVLIGVLSSFQQFFIALSHRLAPASLLAPFRYLSVPFGIIAGIMVFGERLTTEIVGGSIVIVLSSVFILWREKNRRGVV